MPVVEKEIGDQVLDDFEFDDAQRQIVSAIDGKRSIADLVVETRSSSFTVSSTRPPAGARGLRRT